MFKLKFSPNLVTPAHIVGVVGAFLQISGGTWDVASHVMGIVETFFTIPHMILYAGVGLSLLASLTGLALTRTVSLNNKPQSALLTGLKVSLIGGVLQLVAGPFDFWWHSTYGFDPHLFTPSHSLLITGIILSGVGMAIGTTRLVQASRSGLSLGRFASVKLLGLLSVVAFSTLWLDLNGLVYLITDVDGLNYTFHLGDAWVNQAGPVQFVAIGILLAGVGGLVVLTTKRTLGWTGAVSAVTLLTAVVVASANLGFRAWYLTNSANPANVAAGNIIASFIPLQLLFVVPLIIFDLVLRPGRERWLTLGSALMALFASYLDGFYSVALWTNGVHNPVMELPLSRLILIAAMAAPMLVAGAVGAGYQARLGKVLVSSELSLSPRLGVK
ncbi:hypothetical protein AUG19_04910 [archaeon 13_1_20CM_2_54_9]|nr:MAG: hypothetical protein AUG19_04910 [archaeon 13_1_20CM_2_54_9]